MRRFLCFAILCAGASIARVSIAFADDPKSPQELIERFTADEHSLNRYYRLPFDAIDRARREGFLKTWEKTVEAVDFATIDLSSKIDAVLFANHLRHELRALELDAARDRKIAELVPFRDDILALEHSRRTLKPIDPAKVAGNLAKLTKTIDLERERVDKVSRQHDSSGDSLSKIKATVAFRAAGRIGELRDVLRDWFTFYDGYDPVFGWWNKAPYKELDRALDRLATSVREKLAKVAANDRDAIVGDPIGRDALLSELNHEMIVYNPEELIAIAEAEFAFCESELKKASRELGFGDDWRKALESVKEKHIAPGKQPELIRDLALEAVNFLNDHDLVTIPPLCLETWRMEMMSPERQRVNPFFTGGEVISVSYPTDAMSHEEKLMSMRGNNIHFSRATVHHELIPGHHLQGFVARRERPYRKIFNTPFLVEGWSLYWEMLLWDLGFPKTAEDRIGMLFWRSHRCARIIFSLKFHLEEMTPEAAIDFLVDRVGHERANATAEVRRSFIGGYSPLYQCAYMLGGLELRALHHELVGSGKMTNRAFHDAVLKENAVPIEMIRASLTDRPPARDFKPAWKFRDDVPPGKPAPEPEKK